MTTDTGHGGVDFEHLIAKSCTPAAPVPHTIGMPRLRVSALSRGVALRSVRTGLVYVPNERMTGGGWHVIVVRGVTNYPVGGYDLYIPDSEVETDSEVLIW